MRTTRTSMRLALALACVAALAVVAATPTVAGTGAAAAGKTILIGENTIMSGPNAGSYVITQAFHCYLDQVNKSGGVNGYTFTFDTRDNQYTAAQSALVQNQLLANNPFLISVVGTLAVTSAVEVTKNQNSQVPLIVAADGALVQSLASSVPGGLFTYVPNYNYLGPFDAQFIMKNLKDKHFALAFENDVLAQGASQAIGDYVKKNGGSLAATVPVDPTTTDFVPLATQLKASNAKTVLAWGNLGLTASLIKAAAQIGYTPQWVGPFFMFNSAFLRLAGSLADGMYVDDPFPSRGPAVQKFVKTVSQCEPKALSSAGMQGWEMGAMVTDAVRSATAGGKALSQSAFTKALRSMNRQVELMHLDFRKKNWGASNAAIFRIKNNRYVQVTKFTTMPGA